jgi:hypothetical protein
MREQDADDVTWNLLTGPKFWDFWLGLAVGLCHVSAVPHLAGAFAATGEFESAPINRSKTALGLILTVARLGTEDPTTRAKLSRMNLGHRHLGLSREDVTYGLAVVAEFPMRWAENYGRRPWSAAEVAATITFYTKLGRHMGLGDLPDDRAGLQRLIADYERVHLAFSPDGARLVDAQLTDVLGSRRLLQTLGRVGLAATLDDRTRAAIALPALSTPTAAVTRSALRLLSRVMSHRQPNLPRESRAQATESRVPKPAS